MFDDTSKRDGLHFTVSHEVLELLDWLAHSKTDELKMLIKKILGEGLHRILQENSNAISSDQMEYNQESLAAFFSTIEMLLFEAMDELAEQKMHERHLKKTIDLIDGKICDAGLMHSSIEKTAHTLLNKPDSNPREVLFKEILKQWNPRSKNLIN